jgi:hypothetical protein
VNKIEEGGNWNLNFVARGVFQLVTSAAVVATGQTAILECVSVAERGRQTKLLFRLPLGAKPKVERATLLAHVRAGEAPAEVKINGKKAAVARQEKGWVTIAVPPHEALKPLTLEAQGVRFDGCAPPPLAPYVVVEGPPAGGQSK